jgi:hypothetical protein
MEIVPFEKNLHLDQSLMVLSDSLKHPKGKAWFDWKHEQNPFGHSYGFVAVENDRVIGVRLFMPWNFIYQGSVVRAIRPVDTATLPEARGKGIFSRLTLSGIEQLKDKYDFIFNTPNENSRPGYLKMGWKDLQTCQVVYFPVPLFARSEGDIVSIKENLKEKFQLQFDRHEMMTHASDEFCRWRYTDPSVHLAKFSEGAPHGIAVEVIARKGMRILVIKEFWGPREYFFSLVKKLCIRFRTLAVLGIYEHRLFSDHSLRILRQGSRVAFRGPEEIQNRPWYFSLGDIDAKI